MLMTITLMGLFLPSREASSYSRGLSSLVRCFPASVEWERHVHPHAGGRGHPVRENGLFLEPMIYQFLLQKSRERNWAYRWWSKKGSFEKVKEFCDEMEFPILHCPHQPGHS
ncbi:hypothetical protein [Virgibacillus sediminis]|uniref:Secreted protein n=1 Tax=Virgibacillus sediminis TaxID=202260 RepID=A0ABV7A1K1_9BACI